MRKISTWRSRCDRFSSVRLIGILALSRCSHRPVERPVHDRPVAFRELGYCQSGDETRCRCRRPAAARRSRGMLFPKPAFVPEMHNGPRLEEGENFLAEIGDVTIVVDDLDQDWMMLAANWPVRQQIEEAHFFGVVGKAPVHPHCWSSPLSDHRYGMPTLQHQKSGVD